MSEVPHLAAVENLIQRLASLNMQVSRLETILQEERASTECWRYLARADDDVFNALANLRTAHQAIRKAHICKGEPQ